MNLQVIHLEGVFYGLNQTRLSNIIDQMHGELLILRLIQQRSNLYKSSTRKILLGMQGRRFWAGGEDGGTLLAQFLDWGDAYLIVSPIFSYV